MDRSLPGSSALGFSRQESWSGVPVPCPGLQRMGPQSRTRRSDQARNSTAKPEPQSQLGCSDSLGLSGGPCLHTQPDATSTGSLVAESCPTLANPRTVGFQAPLSMGCPRQEYWGGWPFPSPGDLPDPGIEPWSPALQADSLPTQLPETHTTTCTHTRPTCRGFLPQGFSNGCLQKPALMWSLDAREEAPPGEFSASGR